MDEAAAQAWLQSELNVSRETLDRLDSFVSLLRAESEKQNLVARSSLKEIWSRHIVDSAQLIRFAPSAASWVDLGTGAGFPGLIISLLHPGATSLVESRRLRVEFLRKAAVTLNIQPEIIAGYAERIKARKFEVVSARAFAPLDRLLAIGEPLATASTVWILPKGRNAQTELEAAESSWQGDFHIEPSLTDPQAGIIIARSVVRKPSKDRQ